MGLATHTDETATNTESLNKGGTEMNMHAKDHHALAVLYSRLKTELEHEIGRSLMFGEDDTLDWTEGNGIKPWTDDSELVASVQMSIALRYLDRFLEETSDTWASEQDTYSPELNKAIKTSDNMTIDEFVNL